MPLIVLIVVLRIVILVVLLGVIVFVVLGIIVLVVLLGVIVLGVLLGVAPIFRVPIFLVSPLSDEESDVEAFSFAVCILGNDIKLIALPGILGSINENSTDRTKILSIINIWTNSGQNSDKLLINGVTSQ